MKRIKKILVTLVITALAANFLVGIGNVGQAFDWGSGHDWGQLLFGGNNAGSLSFTNYEGGLATLDTEGYDSALTASSDLKTFILKVVNFALGFLGLIAVLMIIYAGVTYVTSAGQDEKTGNAKKTITYAAIGLLIVLGSFAFVNTIIKAALVGEGGQGSQGQFGQNYGQGFNAIAEEVKGIALDIYSGYVVLAENTETFENINTDKNKASLKIEAYPSRATINSFLADTKNKLSSIKAKAGNLTVVEEKINTKIRDMETEMDLLNTMRGPEWVKVESGIVSDCDPNSSSFGDEFDELLTGEETCANDNDPDKKFYKNDAGKAFLTEWKRFQEADAITSPTSPNTDFSEIVKALGTSYADKLEKNLDRLVDIHGTIASISAIETGDASTSYGQMLTDTTAGAGTVDSYKGYYGGLLAAVQDWKLSSDSDASVINSIAESFLVPGLKAHEKYYTALLNLQFVKASLHADTVSGNAPLTVIFDVGNSVDPAGGSIDGHNVIWDPAGTQTVNGVLSGLPKINGGTVTPSGDKGIVVVAKNPTVIVPKENESLCTPQASNAEDGIALTSLRCTFDKPGTYMAMVVVNSNDPTKYGPGISVLKIVANPPTTKIELKGITGSQPEGEYIMHYSNPANTDDPGDINKSQFVVIDSAVQDLILDASSTGAESYKWTFGNGEMAEWSTSLNKVTSKQFGSYDLGSYQVKLEVMNKAGVIDKKIFNLVVKNVDANVASKPELLSSDAKIDENGDITVMVNSLTTFDSSNSVASKGNKITNYKWDIYKIGGKAEVGSGTPVNEGDNQGPVKKTYQYAFTNAGWYEIRLTIQGAGSGPDNMDDTNIKIHVVSKPPVAVFNYDIPETTLPGTVYFTNESFDPDNKIEDLEYSWFIDPPQKDVAGKAGVKNWTVATGKITNNNEITEAKNPVIKFNEKGTYKVKLKTQVKGMAEGEEVAELEKEIEITNTLDVAWDSAKQKSAGKINEDLAFYLKSENVVGYEIAFGDGETSSGDKFPVEGIKHQYKQAGKYIAEVSVFDESDNDNSVKKKILIGGGDMPMSVANLLVNDAEIIDNTKPVEVIRTDKLLFSGSKSVNTDGTGRKLKYSWDFGDTEKSSIKETQHSYSELSPKDKGLYEAKLSIYDESDANKTNQDTVQVNVCPAPPKYTAIEAIPQVAGSAPMTPVVVTTKVYGATDPDNGKIIKYRWWYFDVKDPEEEHGMVVTTSPSAQLTIAAFGDSGAEMEYGIGLEITDNDGLIYCNTETCKEAMVASYKQYPTCEKLKALGEKEVPNNYPSIKVTNEKNESPVAKFSVNPPKAFTGDEFTFTSSSTDTDGRIAKYQWDFEGNGFSDNAPVNEASVKHKYTVKNMEGYEVKLKVFDDKGGEAVSEATKVYVDALGKAPIAAFKGEVVQGTSGQTIKFADLSKPDESADAKLIKYVWDFDLDTDSDGDGNKTNDTDENVQSPQHHFDTIGTYKVKLTVTDDQGNKDDVTNEIKVPLANAPKIALKCDINNATVSCHDLSVADAAGNAEIKSRIWDFDTTSNAATADLNKDGDKINDEDSKDKDTTYVYAASGLYKIKLTVTDDQGNTAELFKDMTIDIAGGTSSVEADSSNGSDPATNTTGSITGTNPTGLGVGIEPKDNNNNTGTTTTPITTHPEIKVEKMVPLSVVKILEINGKTVTDPVPDKDGIIYLTDEKQMVMFNFTGSTGPIAYYTVDTNINYDSSGDGIRDNDSDYKTNLKGIYQTSFKRELGDTHVVKLTVEDIYGNKESITQTIKFK